MGVKLNHSQSCLHSGLAVNKQLNRANPTTSHLPAVVSSETHQQLLKHTQAGWHWWNVKYFTANGNNDEPVNDAFTAHDVSSLNPYTQSRKRVRFSPFSTSASETLASVSAPVDTHLFSASLPRAAHETLSKDSCTAWRHNSDRKAI